MDGRKVELEGVGPDDRTSRVVLFQANERGFCKQACRGSSAITIVVLSELASYNVDVRTAKLIFGSWRRKRSEVRWSFVSV